jgi:predicted Zn-dependent protease
MKQGDTTAAQTWLDQALETVNRPPPAGVFGASPRSKAETIFAATSIEIKLAQPDNKEVLAKAVTEADAARQKFPLSRGIAHQYGEALLAAGKLEEAGVYLRDQAQLYREDIEAYDLLAQVYSKQGKLALQHIALAESYNLQGGVMAALDQLSYARKSPDASFYDQSLIDAREREWQARRREELGDKGKKDMNNASPAFKLEMKSDQDNKDSGFSPYTNPFDRIRQITDPLQSGSSVR